MGSRVLLLSLLCGPVAVSPPPLPKPCKKPSHAHPTAPCPLTSASKSATSLSSCRTLLSADSRAPARAACCATAATSNDASPPWVPASDAESASRSSPPGPEKSPLALAARAMSEGPPCVRSGGGGAPAKMLSKMSGGWGWRGAGGGGLSSGGGEGRGMWEGDDQGVCNWHWGKGNAICN